MNKRRFFGLMVAGGGFAAGGVVGLSALLSALSPSLRRRTGAIWQPVGDIDRFPVGRMTKAVVPVPRDDWAHAIREKSVFVRREGEDRAVVFSRSCTDLGCPVAWDPGSGWFYCPCHGGIFDEHGVPRAGPPQIPLYRYKNRIRDRVLEVDLNSVPSIL